MVEVEMEVGCLQIDDLPVRLPQVPVPKGRLLHLDASHSNVVPTASWDVSQPFPHPKGWDFSEERTKLDTIRPERWQATLARPYFAAVLRARRRPLFVFTRSLRPILPWLCKRLTLLWL